MPNRSAPKRASGRRRPLKGRLILDERTERRLRRIRWRRIGIALGAVALLVGAIVLYRSPLLRVQEVQVVGTTNVDAAEVARLAGLRGDSMLRLSTAGAEERIEALPLVKSVEIVRDWPSTVRIQVTERLPWGTWRIGDASYVIDADGIVLPEVKPPKGAPVVVDKGAPARLIPGDRVDVDAVALARTMLKQVPELLGMAVSGLEYTPEDGLAVVTEGGYRVVLGDSQNVDYKLAVWQAVEAELGREAMAGHVLDLRFEDRPSFQ